MLIFDKLLAEITGETLLDELAKIKKTPLDLFEENDPNKSDTIGELASKLSCSTVQMWNNQNILYQIRFMSIEEFRKTYDKDELHAIIKRACDLNVQRAAIVDAIDAKLLTMKKEGIL